MDMLRAQEVTFQYEYANKEPHVVLRGIDLHVEKGSFVAVLGHNGSGKSTFAKHLNGMLLPTGGAVFVKDMNTADESVEFEVRRLVGMVLQNPDNQIISTIVEEDVAFGPENLGIAPAEIRNRVDDALKTVGMYEYRHHAPDKLSGGQKQRVAIAGILAMQPECLVLDEPTAMLDPQGRQEVLETVHRLNRETGMTVVMITHYMEEAVSADRVIIMDDGKILFDGTPRAVFSHADELRAISLNVPQPTELCLALKKRGMPISTDLLTVEECVDAVASLLEGVSCR